MLKRITMVLALVLLPGAAIAQHTGHHAKEATKAEHTNFARELIAAQADLKLTSEQITRLEAFSVKMDAMHKKMAEHHGNAQGHAQHDDAAKAEGKMHADLLAIFTEEQLVKVRPLMKAHMEKCEHMKSEKKTEHKH